MSQQNEIKVGDLITAYHKGFHEVKRLYSIPDGRGNECPQVDYEKRYNENGTVAKGQKKSCSINYCTLAKDFIPERIKQLQEEIDNLQKLNNK